MIIFVIRAHPKTPLDAPEIVGFKDESRASKGFRTGLNLEIFLRVFSGRVNSQGKLPRNIQ